LYVIMLLSYLVRIYTFLFYLMLHQQLITTLFPYTTLFRSIDKLKAALKTKHLEAIIVLSDYNRRYLSGFTGTSGALIITNEEKLLLTDFRYIEQATTQAADFKVIKQQGQLIESIKSTLEELNVQNVGFEGNLVSYDTY